MSSCSQMHSSLTDTHGKVLNSQPGQHQTGQSQSLKEVPPSPRRPVSAVTACCISRACRLQARSPQVHGECQFHFQFNLESQQWVGQRLWYRWK